jgi:hypothetical protein
MFLRILNRGVALAGVALHFDARALTAARHVLEVAQRSARLGFWTNSLCRQTWVAIRRFCLGILNARWTKEVASDRGIRLVGHSVRIFTWSVLQTLIRKKIPYSQVHIRLPQSFRISLLSSGGIAGARKRSR